VPVTWQRLITEASGPSPQGEWGVIPPSWQSLVFKGHPQLVLGEEILGPRRLLWVRSSLTGTQSQQQSLGACSPTSV